MLTSIWMANDPGAETGVLIMDLFLQWNVATGLSIWSEFNGILWSDNLINANGNMKEWAFLFIGLDLSDLIVDLFRHFPFIHEIMFMYIKKLVIYQKNLQLM